MRDEEIMMRNHVHRDTPVPVWLNIDAVCPPELREQAIDLANELEFVIDKIDELGHQAYLLGLKIEKCEPGSDPDEKLEQPWEWWHRYTGMARVRDALTLIERHAAAGRNDSFPGEAPGWHPASDMEPGSLGSVHDRPVVVARREAREATEADAE